MDRVDDFWGQGFFVKGFKGPEFYMGTEQGLGGGVFPFQENLAYTGRVFPVIDGILQWGLLVYVNGKRGTPSWRGTFRDLI
jgi:hypothetical protein